jgi:hypothetical protein
VENSELIFGVVLVAVLVGLAGYYGWRQVRALRGLRRPDERSEDERQYIRRQAWRRLVCCGLMVVLAGMLVGSTAFDSSERQLRERGEEALQSGETATLNPDESRFLKLYAAYWIICLLVLLGILVLAGMDLMAIRRYGRRQFLQIQADRRAMIEQEVARLRHDRNGHV